MLLFRVGLASEEWPAGNDPGFYRGLPPGIDAPAVFFPRGAPAGHPRATRNAQGGSSIFLRRQPAHNLHNLFFLVHPVAVWKRDAAMTMLASGRATLAPSRFLPRPAPFGHCFILPRSPLLAHARLRRADHALTSLLAPTNLTPRRNSGTKRQRRWRAPSDLRRSSGARGFRFWRFLHQCIFLFCGSQLLCIKHIVKKGPNQVVCINKFSNCSEGWFRASKIL